MSSDCHDGSIKRDLLIAAVPTVVAILLQKALDELSAYFSHKRDMKAKLNDKPTTKDEDSSRHNDD